MPGSFQTPESTTTTTTTKVAFDSLETSFLAIKATGSGAPFGWRKTHKACIAVKHWNTSLDSHTFN